MAVESPWHIFNVFRSIDRFGQPIPTFNISGKNKINTVVGGILSALILAITLSYFMGRLEGLITGSNQIINYNVIQSFYGLDKGFDIAGAN